MTDGPVRRSAVELGIAMPAMLAALTRANIGYLVFLDRDGVFTKWDANDAAMRNLGYSREEWLAKPMFDVISPDQREITMQLYRRLLAGESLTPTVELTFIDKQGQPIGIEVAYGHATVAEGNTLVLIWADRSRHLPTQLSTLEADRNSLVGALAAGFAHETNNPLTSVLLNLRSLRKLLVASLVDAKQAAAVRVVDDITTGAERIASNVRAFQTLASRSGGQSVDLVAVASAVLRLATPTLEPHAHVVRQIYAVRPVIGEESRLAQAVLAMLLFAVSGFMQPGDPTSRIVVTVAERAGSIIVEVSDNGTDLKPDELPRAFDPFFRSTRRGAGVGGGLAVARSIAISLGGDVSLAAAPSGGVVITMSLPPAPDAHQV